MTGVLDQYKSVYDTAKSPLVRLDLKGQSQALSQMSTWTTAQSGVTAYVDLSGVHVSGAGSVPVTVPTGSTVNGGVAQPVLRRAVRLDHRTCDRHRRCRPGDPAGGYVPVGTPPAAPAAPTATAGNASATVTWTAPADNGNPITGYKVYSSADNFTAAVASPTASPATVTGLTNGTGYTFKVSAVNGTGEGPAVGPVQQCDPGHGPGRADHRHRHRRQRLGHGELDRADRHRR